MATAPSLKIVPPAGGEKITIRNGKLAVPDQPIIPFIERSEERRVGKEC